MIRASIWQLNVALIFERSIKMQPIFQLIDVFVLNKNDSRSLMAAHANFMRQLIDASKRGVLHALLIIDDAVHSFSVSEGAQDVNPAAIRKESFKVINGSNAKGARANIQTYCCVKIAALKLQRNKDFQFIVESDSQGGRQNDPVVGINPKTCWHSREHELLSTC